MLNQLQKKGEVFILSAVNAQGSTIVLAGPERKMLALRLKDTPHFCPQCGQPVIVKAGEINTPHFAHLSISSCNSFSEPESPRHLSGKLDLFNWISNTADAKLEARLPDGAQRPDILSGQIAIEFQCSAISADLFQKRTTRYLARGMTPFWIYGGIPVERKGRFIKLTPFQRLFLRYHHQLGIYLICYCPNVKLVTIYGRIVPLTPTLCAAEQMSVLLRDLPFPPSIVLPDVFTFQLQSFFDEKRKWIERSLYYRNARSHPFFKAVYESGQNPHLLPEQIGLPVRSGAAIRNHPVEWQFYIQLEKGTGTEEEIIRRRIKLGHLKPQKLPLAEGITVEGAVKEYKELLADIGEKHYHAASSMGTKLRQEEAFRIKHEKRIKDKLIF